MNQYAIHATVIYSNIIIEKGNVLFFQLQCGTYLPTFRLDALAILTLTKTSEDKFHIEVERREP